MTVAELWPVRPDESSGRLPGKVSLLYKETRNKQGLCHLFVIWKLSHCSRCVAVQSHLSPVRRLCPGSWCAQRGKGQDRRTPVPWMSQNHWINQPCSWPFLVLLVMWDKTFVLLFRPLCVFHPLQKYPESKRNYIKTGYSLKLLGFIYMEILGRKRFLICFVLYDITSRTSNMEHSKHSVFWMND